MADRIRLYISAAADLDRERDVLGRSVSEMPVQLGWLIRQSPRKNEMLDLDAVSKADVHLLLIGGDIRAPIGLEWYRARQAGRQPVLFLKSGIKRTPAAQEFIRYVGNQASWEPFENRADLRFKVLLLLVEYIIGQSASYALSPSEVDTLTSWWARMKQEPSDFMDDVVGGAGESGQIYSTERYIPSSGILLDPADNEGSGQE